MTDYPGQATSSQDTEEERSEGQLELFFDLVFVFTMFQVTQLMLQNLSWVGFGRGVLALLAVWWAWAVFTWLTNIFYTDQVTHRILMIAAMAAMLVAASALPTAFSTGAQVFGVALLIVRLIHAVKFLIWSARDSEELRARTRRLTPAFVIAPSLILGAAFVDSPYRELMWILAACIDFGAPLVVGMGGFRVVPRYFVARHGAMIIIVLGEAIVELGLGVEDPRNPGVIATLVLGVLVCATLWWSYFGLTAGAEERLRQATGVERAVLARDAYSYLHLPLFAGVAFFALGAHETVVHSVTPLSFLPALALTGGVGLFYLGDVAYRWRDHHQLTTDRLITGIASLSVLAFATQIPAVATLAVLTAIGVVRLAWELWRQPRVGPVRAGHPR